MAAWVLRHGFKVRLMVGIHFWVYYKGICMCVCVFKHKCQMNNCVYNWDGCFFCWLYCCVDVWKISNDYVEECTHCTFLTCCTHRISCQSHLTFSSADVKLLDITMGKNRWNKQKNTLPCWTFQTNTPTLANTSFYELENSAIAK